jgi:uncharacterized protein (TIGR02466 family)
MKQREFNLVFPIAILRNNFDRNLNNSELNYIKNLKKRENVLNTVTTNTNVLKDPILTDLKQFILKEVNVYFSEIIKTNNVITPYITQSWCNYTYQNQGHHHQHRHQNSFLSGVLYIKSLKEKDSIKFTSPVWQTFSFNIKEYNALNSQSMSFAVESGDLLLFPSYLEHSVETKVDNKERISLAFNTFIKGNIGSEVFLTKLSL